MSVNRISVYSLFLPNIPEVDLLNCDDLMFVFFGFFLGLCLSLIFLLFEDTNFGAFFTVSSHFIDQKINQLFQQIISRLIYNGALILLFSY